MPDLLPVTLADMIAEVQRELAMRERVYPQWKIGASIGKRNQMDRQCEVMEAVLKYLEGQKNGTQ
jgi:hypothetical protein